MSYIYFEGDSLHESLLSISLLEGGQVSKHWDSWNTISLTPLLQPLLGLQRKTSLFNATVLLITQFPAENFVKTTSPHNKAFCVSVRLWIFV